MQQSIKKCPKVSIYSKGVQIPLLLDSGSEVSLICQSNFKEHLMPRIETPTDEKVDAHVLFNVTEGNHGQLPMKMYTELDVNFLGLKVPNSDILILEEPYTLLDKKIHKRFQAS